MKFITKWRVKSAIRRARATLAVMALQSDSVKSGGSAIAMNEINVEIKKARKKPR